METKRRGGWRWAWLLGGLLVGLLGACGGGAPEVSAPAGGDDSVPDSGREPRTEIVESLRSARGAVNHPSDGGGTAWLEETPVVTAGSAGRFVVVYEAGPEGVAEGGVVFLQVSPFWGWSTPQVERPELPGYTSVSFEGSLEEGDSAPELDAQTIDQQLLAVRFETRGLGAGERLRFVYGDGLEASRVDRYAEDGEHFWIAVDGDGDGYRSLIAEPPRLDVEAGPPARLVAVLPSTSRPGEPVLLRLSVLDAEGSSGTRFEGTLELAAEVDLGALLEPVRFAFEDGGVRAVELRPTETGVLRVEVRGPGGLIAESNPLLVAEKGRRVVWGDLQNHSNFSDGTALPEQLYAYGRDVAGLDVMSVTDHDHWGLRFLDEHPEMWRHIQDVTERLHEPDLFVTVRGFEWTNWIHGHRHVLVFDREPFDVWSSIDDSHDHPSELWAELEGRRALTVAHHSAGGPIATDWTIAPPPELETVTEVVSVHGSSEAADSPKLIYRPVAGNFVRDAALGRGYKLGLIGSSDGHDGHPGMGHLASGVGGLAAIMTEELTRDGVYEALRARRTYATSGIRILLRVVYGGYLMGSDVPLEGGVARRGEDDEVAVEIVPPDQLLVQVVAPGELGRVDLVRSGELSAAFDCEGRRECTFAATVDDLEDGDYLYVRAVQLDEHFAVSSPFFFSAEK